MIRRLGLMLLALCLGSAASSPPVASQTAIAPVSINVAGREILLAPADADALQRRINRPPLLEDVPAAAAPSYVVTTEYWDRAIREDEDDPPVAEDADYFPAGGFVRASQDGEDAWIVLDLRQRALLNRYIRYVEESLRPELVDPQPGALLVVFLKAFGVDEPVGIQTGNRRLDPDEARRFWESVAPHLSKPVFVEPPSPPEASDADGYWVTFTLIEGRSLPYFLDTSAGTLTDSLGTEVYDISTAAGGGIPESALVTQIEQEDPAGSSLWWLLAVVGGTGLIALVGWMRGRSNSQSNVL